MKAVIIDDEPLARMLVLEYLQKFSDIEIVAECSDGFQGFKAITELQPDLVFLDIQMPKINGFEMLEMLTQKPAVIFTTAFDEYAIKAFDNHAIDYLLKPFSEERFSIAVNKAIQLENLKTQQQKTEELLQSSPLLNVQQNRVVVKSGSKIKVIPTIDIIYLEAADDYVKVYTHEGSFLKNKTMGYFEQTLTAVEFVRCHRSYIVQVSQITRIEPYEKDSYLAILKNNAKVPVSKTGYQKLKLVLGL